jgi:hypothetical protein
VTAADRCSSAVKLCRLRPHPGGPHYVCRDGVLVPCPISTVGTAAGPPRSGPSGLGSDADGPLTAVVALVVLS